MKLGDRLSQRGKRCPHCLFRRGSAPLESIAVCLLAIVAGTESKFWSTGVVEPRHRSASRASSTLSVSARNCRVRRVAPPDSATVRFRLETSARARSRAMLNQGTAVWKSPCLKSPGHVRAGMEHERT